MGIAISIKKAIITSEGADGSSRANSTMGSGRSDPDKNNRKTPLFVSNQESQDLKYNGIQDESIESRYGSQTITESSMKIPHKSES